MLKGILEFVLDENRLNLFFMFSVFLFPLTGFVAGYFHKILISKSNISVLEGIFWGSVGGLISLLWFLYNIIMNHYGLDSVKALLINLLIFLILGTALGILYRRLLPVTKDGAEQSSIH